MTPFVEIAGVSLDTPAWVVLNPMELRQGPPTRGTDRLIPGAAGVLPGRRRAAPARRPLRIAVNGEFDPSGEPHLDPHEGLDSNLMSLRSLVADPQLDPVDCVLYLPDGGTAAGLVHVESFTWTYLGTDAMGVIDLTVLHGSLIDEEGS